MSRKQQRKRLYRLVKEKPICYWCKREVKLYKKIEKGEVHPLDMATIDHKCHRLDPAREEVYKTPGEKTVLACLECNRKRGREDLERFKNKLPLQSNNLTN